MKLNQDSVDFYDKFDSQRYHAYYSRVSAYIESVNSIIAWECGNRRFHLDVGAGNGERSRAISYQLGAELTVMDNSSEMCNICSQDIANVIHGDIENYAGSGSYDLITVLGNVFGHIDNRGKALTNLHRLAGPNCKVIFDVNNRYNCLAYGVAALNNILVDFFWPSKTNGYFPMLNYDSDCYVYLHNTYELDYLIDDAGFKMKKIFVNYKSGRRTLPIFGQIVYVLSC